MFVDFSTGPHNCVTVECGVVNSISRCSPDVHTNSHQSNVGVRLRQVAELHPLLGVHGNPISFPARSNGDSGAV